MGYKKYATSTVQRAFLIGAVTMVAALPVYGGYPIESQADSSAESESLQEEILDPFRPQLEELETSIDDGFTLAAVGDCVVTRPHAQMLGSNPGLAAAVDILRGVDVAFANLETSIIDFRHFNGYQQAEDGGCWCIAAPEVASDLKTLGFDLLGRANNHTMDWGVEGMRESGRRLDRSGLVHAGAGENRG